MICSDLIRLLAAFPSDAEVLIVDDGWGYDPVEIWGEGPKGRERRVWIGQTRADAAGCLSRRSRIEPVDETGDATGEGNSH